MPQPERVKVLFCHKCNEQTHRIGARLRNSLRSCGIDLEIENFDVGYDLYTRMQTFAIEAVLFLYSSESWASRAVQFELESAAKQGFPLFIVHCESELPFSLKTRASWRIQSLDDQNYETGIAKLARSILERTQFNRQIRLLNPSSDWHHQMDTARSIAVEASRTLLAEAASELAERYKTITDPQTRYWIAVALGRAGTPQAAALIAQLPRTNHPLEVEGIRQAQEMFPNHPIRPC